MPKHFLFLLAAVVAETIGTSMLLPSQQFTRWMPTLGLLVAYGVSFYFLSIAVQGIPVGVMYAIWSGLGIVLIAIIAFLVFGQKLDLAAVLGIALILAGIVVIQLFSNTASHSAG